MPLFGGCNVAELKDLQVLQNKVAQIVTHCPPYTNRNRMFDNLDRLTVTQLVRYFTLLAVFRIRMSGEPEYLASSLCNMNNYGKIIVQNTRLTLLKKSFTIRSACNWNALPENIRSIGQISIFKKKVKVWIKEFVPRFLD